MSGRPPIFKGWHQQIDISMRLCVFGLRSDLSENLCCIPRLGKLKIRQPYVGMTKRAGWSGVGLFRWAKLGDVA